MQLSSPGDHISIVFSVKLLLKLIWLKVSSAFNLGQRQQWNFPSLSCGSMTSASQWKFPATQLALYTSHSGGWNQLRPVRTGLVWFKCTWYKRELRVLACTSALDFNKRSCVGQI